MKSHTTKQAAFTLIELSIVLVIIGLIVSGVLVGQDLIRAAQVRAQVAQIEKLNVAVNAFRTKYNCIPGDCPNAVEKGLGTAGGDGDDGDGSGTVDAGDLGAQGNVIGIETQNFWYHLGKANMIANIYPVGQVPGVNSPSTIIVGNGHEGNPRGGVWLVNRFVNTFANGSTDIRPAWLLTDEVNQNGVWNYAAIFYPDISYMMDTKMDDGYPSTGSFQISQGPHSLFQGGSTNGLMGDNTIATVSSGVGPDACFDDTHTPYTYNLVPASSLGADWIARLCMPIIRAAF